MTTPNTAANGGQIPDCPFCNGRAVEIGYEKNLTRCTECGATAASETWKSRASLAAALASEPQQEREAALADRDEVPYLIVFDDHDRQNELVYGGTRARYRFKEISASWNANLFVKIAGNSRDDKTPCYIAAPAPVLGMPDLASLQRFTVAGSQLGFARGPVEMVRFSDISALFAPQAPDTPVALKFDSHPSLSRATREASEEIAQFKSKLVAAPLPAAPAPTDSLISILEEISVTDLAYKQRDLAIKALEILAAPAPTEQAGELPPDEDEDEEDGESAWRRLALQFDGHRLQALGHLRALLADPAKHASAANEFLSAGPLSGDAVLAQRIDALAARQAPAEGEFAKVMSDVNVTHIACMMGNMIYNLAQKKGHMLTAADCEMFNNLRKQWDAARQAPDSRNAALELAARACEKRAEQRFSDHGITEPDTGAQYYYVREPGLYDWLDEEDDDCAEAIRALKGLAQ
jgi:ribosomal protein L37AE/L43A